MSPSSKSIKQISPLDCERACSQSFNVLVSDVHDDKVLIIRGGKTYSILGHSIED